MAKRKTNSYWLSLIAMLLVVSMVLSVGDTQARYVNTTVWNTVVYPTSEAVFSDCLRPEGQVILLGEMELDALEITFQLESTQDVAGKIEATVDLDELLQVELSHETVELEAYEFVTVTMTLIPTEKAISAVRPEMDVDIFVTWGNMLSGTFRVTLPELTEEDLGIVPTEPEETDPEETEPEVTEPEVTEPEATEPEATESQPTEPEPTETDPTESESTEPEQTPTETTTPETSQPETEETTEATQATEATQPETGEPAQTPENSNQSGGNTADTNINEDASAENEASQQGVTTLSVMMPRYTSRAAVGLAVFMGSRIRTMSSVSAADSDVAVADPTESTSGEPNVISEDDPSESTDPEESTAAAEDTTASTGESTASPEESSAESSENQSDNTTQPSASGDSDLESEETSTGVTLGTVDSFDPEANLPLLVTPDENTTLVRLGFSEVEDGVLKVTQFPAYTRYSLDGETYFMLYFGGVIDLDTTGVESKSLLLDLSDLNLSRNQDVVLVAEAYEESALLGRTSTYSVANADIDYSLNTRVITSGVPTMILSLPDDWKKCHLDYVVYMLVSDQETGAMSYQVVELNAKGLKATHSYGAASPHQLILELGEEKPLPGTYRLSISWTFEGICFAKTQTTFFINYSGSR